MNPILNPLGNNIMDPLGVTPPMMWEQQPPVKVIPPSPRSEFQWNFLYTEAIIAFAFVAAVWWWTWRTHKRSTSKPPVRLEEPHYEH